MRETSPEEWSCHIWYLVLWGMFEWSGRLEDIRQIQTFEGLLEWSWKGGREATSFISLQSKSMLNKFTISSGKRMYNFKETLIK